jgi:hypothetical protein
VFDDGMTNISIRVFTDLKNIESHKSEDIFHFTPLWVVCLVDLYGLFVISCILQFQFLYLWSEKLCFRKPGIPYPTA